MTQGLVVLAAGLILQLTQGCNIANVPYASVRYSHSPRSGKYRPGTTVWIQCWNGYEMKGKGRLFCDRSDNWDADMPKCTKPCANPSTFFGGQFYPDKPKYMYEDKVYYACPRNRGKHTYSACQMDGKWKQASQCYDYCMKPKTDYGMYKPKKDVYYYGEKVSYECPAKYYGEKSGKMKCGANGNWEKKQMCKKYCEAPDHMMYYQKPYAKKMYMEGEKIYYVCKDGYYKESKYQYTYATCMNGGKWDNMPYKCAKKCMAPQHDKYYQMPYGKKMYMKGEYIMYMCKDGYYKDSKYTYDKAMCKKDGNWDKAPYKCMKKCMAPKHDTYNQKPYAKKMFMKGDYIKYMCKDGYYKDAKYGYDKAMCMKDGNWDQMPYKCMKKCMAPKHEDFKHKPYAKKMYMKGEYVKYMCKDGYYKDSKYGYVKAMCMDDGNWDQTPYKCMKYCAKPTIEHGMPDPEKKMYSYGDKVSYKCMDGYMLFYEGPWFQYSTCMKDGMWDFAPPICKKKAVMCKKPYFGMNGVVEPMKNKYEKGNRISFKCKAGYKAFYDKEWFEYATCKDDGNWDFDPPMCRSMKNKYCMPDEVEHGSYFPNMKVYMEGDRMYHRCEPGYGLFFEDVWYEYRTCGNNGKWDFKPPTCKSMKHSSGSGCMGHDVAHGRRRPNKKDYADGEKVYYDCAVGYEKQYDGEEYEYAMCKKGMWNKPPPMCKSIYKNYCYPPRVMHGSYYPSTPKRFNYGDRLRFKCKYGYEMHFHKARYEYATCGRDGNWDMRPPMCKSNKMDYCDAPEIEHGSYKPKMKIFSTGQRLYYTKCDDGYILSYGKVWFEYNECKEDGNWKYMHPMCVMKSWKAYCDPPKIENGSPMPRKGAYSYGNKISFKCKDGYELYSRGRRYQSAMCKSGGYWDKKAPMCKKAATKYCYPPAFHHGSYSPLFMKYQEGSRLYYECDRGFKMVYKDVEYEYNKCVDGKWRYESPKCMDMKKKYCKAPVFDGELSPEMKMYGVGARLRFKCRDSYYADYQGKYYGYATCGRNGKWDKKPPMCKRKPTGVCMPHPIKNGRFSRSKTVFYPGDWVSYVCEVGYTKYYVGKAYSLNICGKNGKWQNPSPICVKLRPKFCPKPTIEHGSYKPMMDYYGLGERLYVKCKPGYYKYYEGGYSQKYSTCMISGVWDRLPVCKMLPSKMCKAPNHRDFNHMSYYKKMYMEGEWIKYQCDYGYYPPPGLARDYARCTKDGNWDAEPYKCRKYCMSEEMMHGSHSPMKMYYSVNEKVQYSCKDGYELKFQGPTYAYRTCMANGNWDEKIPLCKKYCNAPISYYNGYYSPRKYKFAYGEKITFYCSRGYIPNKRYNQVYCGRNGKWAAEIPLCIRNWQNTRG